MSRPVAIILMLAIGLAAFFAGRMTQSNSEARSETRRAPSVKDLDDYVTKEAYDAVHAELAQAQVMIAAQRTQLAKAAAATPEPASEGPDDPVTEAVGESAPRFVFEGEEEMLRSIDWKVMGEALHAMPALLHELREAMAATPPDRARLLAVSGKIQQWNGPLVGQAAHMEKANLSGTGTNGVWTHPVLVVNEVYATLAQSAHKMTAAQIPQLQQIGDRFKEAEARRVAAYTDDTFGVQQVIEETALRDELFAAIDGILSAEQRNVLHPEESRGYTTADLFSSALLWNTLVQPIQFGTRAELATHIANMIVAREKVPEAQHDTVRAITSEWAGAIPDALLNEPQSPAVDIRIMPVSHIAACAKQNLKLRKELATRVPDDAFRARMRDGKGVVVWFKS